MHKLALTVSFALVSTSLARSQQSQTLFDAPMGLLDENNRIEATLDFDGDGESDLLSVWWSGSSTLAIRGLRGDAEGSFELAWQRSLTVGSSGYNNFQGLAGDLDGDGRDDFVVTGRTVVAVYLSDSGGAPTKIQEWDEGLRLAMSHIGDIDGDGYGDLVTIVEHGVVRVHMNTGPAGGYQLVQTTSTQPGSGLEARATELMDVSGDGVLDLLFFRSSAANSYVQGLVLNPDGTVLETRLLGAWIQTFGTPNSAKGDIDGDGDEDVVIWDVSSYTSLPFYCTLRRIDGDSFEAIGKRLGGPATDLADVNGDGYLDGVCCGGGSGGIPDNDQYSRFEIALNDGTGAFANSFQIPALGSQRIAGVEDIDHDGDVDLIAGRVVYYARGPITGPIDQPLVGGVHGPAGIHDFDLDGDPDLDVGLGTMLEGDGAGGFSPRANPASPNTAGPGYPGDWDGDGDVDLLVSRFQGAAFHSMRLYENDGLGHFADSGRAADPGVSFNPTGQDDETPAERSLACDLEGDGDLDLIVRSITFGSSGSSVWLNDGTGYFHPMVAYDTWSIRAAGDLDGDGLLDLLLADGSLAYALADGQGGFGPPVAAFPGLTNRPASTPVIAEDMDADGDVDVIALSDWTTNSAALFINDGAAGFSGSYLPAFTDPDAGAPYLYAVDLDGNGYRDVVIGPVARALFEPDQGISYYLRTADGQGFEPLAFSMLRAPALVDLDGDGDLEGIDADYRLGTRFDGEGAGVRRQYGVGSPGSGGIVPILGATGPFRLGETVRVTLRGGLGGSIAQMTLGFAPSEVADAPFAGMTMYNAPWFRRLPMHLSGAPGVPGVGEGYVQTVVPAGLIGLDLYHQAYVVDPGAPFGLSSTGGLELRYR